MTNVLLCLLWELVSKVSPLFFLFFYRRKWYLEAQTGCPAARPDCEPPPNTVKWLKLIQDPESSAVFFFHSLVLHHLEGFRKRRGGHNDFLLVCLKHRQTTCCVRLSPSVSFVNVNSVYVQRLMRWTWWCPLKKNKQKNLYQMKTIWDHNVMYINYNRIRWTNFIQQENDFDLKRLSKSE